MVQIACRPTVNRCFDRCVTTGLLRAWFRAISMAAIFVPLSAEILKVWKKRRNLSSCATSIYNRSTSNVTLFSNLRNIIAIAFFDDATRRYENDSTTVWKESRKVDEQMTFVELRVIIAKPKTTNWRAFRIWRENRFVKTQHWPSGGVEKKQFRDERASDRIVRRRPVEGRTIVWSNVKCKFVYIIIVPLNVRTQSSEIGYVRVLHTRVHCYCVAVTDWLSYRL